MPWVEGAAATPEGSAELDLFAGEQLVLVHERALDLRSVIVIDNTLRGPGLGGVRYQSYASDVAAIRECVRLAGAMTLKHAAAGLPYGGAKAVIMPPRVEQDRRAVMQAFGKFVARLDGLYIPAVDLGTAPSDLYEIGKYAPEVECDKDDPAPWTALGVRAGIVASVEHALGGVGVAGRTIAIQGVGHVGAALAHLLASDGAELLIADIDRRRAEHVAAEVGGQVVHSDTVLEEHCDVLAPCSAAQVIGPWNSDRLRCRVIAGAANDPIVDDATEADLAGRGIVYVPDFLVNAGGVISLHARREGWAAERQHAEVSRIGQRVGEILIEATRSDRTPLGVARALAMAQLSS